MLTENEESQKSDVAKREEEVLTFWRENQIFEKSLTKDSPNGEFVFYDGPPFATGLPHYGHLLAGTMKDVVPRFKTMKGFHVRRRWGWDCHGLPVENLVEKELGLKNKKDIEDFGIDSFNEKARESVLRYADEWKRIVPRMGRFVDMEDDYRTMDSTYTETVWWVFKTLYDRGLIYEGYKSMHICPRCETTLSNFEVTQGYKDVTDISVTVKFELVDEPGTYLLAWTTTPWTLPGNVALAINKEIVYCQVKSQRPKAKDEAQNRGEEEEVLIVAKDRLAEVFKNTEYRLEKEFLGADLISKKYKPVFDNYKDLPLKDVKGKDIAGVAKVWQIVEADFVTTESGTGIVHIAPAFGEDDYQLALKEGLPFIQHVNMSGEFKSEMGELAGQKVKPIESPQVADIEIIKLLATRNLLFSKEKITHAYPHCWRCATPLLNYAASSWFVKVTDLKDKLLEANQGIGWVPAHFREGRFGKWLSGARDWVISRSRFWGAPLPVWRCEVCNQTEVVGSLADLIKLQQGRNNTFTFMRHGQAESNLRDAISIDPNGPNRLTEQGKEEVRLSAQKLKEKKMDMIVSSDFVRTKETAELLAEELGLSEDEVVFDERLRELNTGNFLGKTWAEYDSQVGPLRKRFERQPEKGGENYNMVRRRMMALVYELNEKYQNKNFLIVSHGLPLFLATATMRHLSLAEMEKEKGFATGEVREVPFLSVPHNKNFELDFHRPYIDDFALSCACGGNLRRIPDVFDCWFESGAMPYGQDHYPFETSRIEPQTGKGFPADFIAEGQDQTRGWFYSLLVLGIGLFGKSPYRQVIANGMVLAEDGQKMSKKLKNYPDPMVVVDRYGADALRFYLMSSPAVRAEDLNFSEKGIAETYRKNIARLLNVLSFFETYAEELPTKEFNSRQLVNVLDRWIMSRLGGTIVEVERVLDNYEIDRASRPIEEFIEDLSVWYLRRSRDRFKSDDKGDREEAIATTYHVLKETAKLLAPICPFVAEEIYLKLKKASESESVHLAKWPNEENNLVYIETPIGEEMAAVRQIVSLALEFRQAAGLKVRQPLRELRVKSQYLALRPEYHNLILEELNVKKLVFDPKLSDEVWLDTEMDDGLKQEGESREFIRNLQEYRKSLGLTPSDKIVLCVEAPDEGREMLRRFEKEVIKAAGLKRLDYGIVKEGWEILVNGKTFKVKIGEDD